MAIVILGSGTTGPVDAPVTTINQNVPLAAGTNRMLYVAAMGSASSPNVVNFLASVSYGGLQLAVINDGTRNAGRVITNTFTTARSGLFGYALRESALNLLAPGPHTLQTIWSTAPGTGTVWSYAIAWWLVANVTQPASASPNVYDVRFAETNSAAAGSVSITSAAAGLASDALFEVACKIPQTAFTDLRFDGVVDAADFDVSLPLHGYRFSGASKLPGGNVAATTYLANFPINANQGAQIIGWRAQEAIPPTPGQVALTYREPWSVAVEWTQ